MNKSQVKYLFDRISSISVAKKVKFREGNRVAGLSTKEKVELINSGKVKAKTINEDSYGRIFSFFDFSVFEKGKIEADKKISDYENWVDTEANRIKDEIMLGDESSAMKLLAEFSKDTTK